LREKDHGVEDLDTGVGVYVYAVIDGLFCEGCVYCSTANFDCYEWVESSDCSLEWGECGSLVWENSELTFMGSKTYAWWN
jgi:hypothetical protein